MEVVVFSDAGIDDIAALMHLFTAVDVKAIVGVEGNGSAAKAYSTLNYFFGERTEVLQGLIGNGKNHYIHEALEELEIALDEGPSVDMRTELFCKDTVIVSLAPMTDLAKLLPRLKSERIHIMGGAVRVAGNDSPYAEFNFLTDPCAAQQVLSAGRQVTIVPLDVTTFLRFKKNDIEVVDDNRVQKLLSWLLDHYQGLGEDSFPLHDLTTALCLTTPEGTCKCARHCEVDVRGRLLVDEHRYRRKPANAEIVNSIDETVLKYSFIERQ